ncbi:MAG: DUF2281 domain-containing protein, partial [Microcystaceae cyanobacterium]
CRYIKVQSLTVLSITGLRLEMKKIKGKEVGAVASLEKAILEKVRNLPPDRQQQILDFAEFLQSKSGAQPPPGEPLSFLEATQEFAGCLEGGPADLSSNKKYLEGLGTE